MNHELLWGLLFGAVFVASALGGAVVALVGMSLISFANRTMAQMRKPVPYMNPDLVKQKLAERERQALFESQWVNPAFGAEDIRDVPLRGSLKRVGNESPARAASPSGAFFPPPVKNGVAGLPRPGAAPAGGKGPSPS